MGVGRADPAVSAALTHDYGEHFEIRTYVPPGVIDRVVWLAFRRPRPDLSPALTADSPDGLRAAMDDDLRARGASPQHQLRRLIAGLLSDSRDVELAHGPYADDGDADNPAPIHAMYEGRWCVVTVARVPGPGDGS